MSDSSKAKVMMEQGQSFTAMVALSDSGDNTTFTSGGALWSEADGKSPDVKVNGLLTGGKISVGSGNDNVAVAALTCNLNGVETSVAADATNAITRPASAVSKINSITVNSSGAYAVVAGTDGATTAFSETRGAAGGPPYIPTDSIEVGQVRITSDTSAAIEASEIFQVLGTHMEKADYPGYTADNENGQVVFDFALPLIHTGDLPKAVHAQYYEGILVELPNCEGATLPEYSHSVSSQTVYNGALGTKTQSIGQGGFTQYGGNGHTDPILTWKDQNLWFKLFSDRNKTPYSLCQGYLGIARQFNASGQNAAVCTITSTTVATDHAS